MKRILGITLVCMTVAMNATRAIALPRTHAAPRKFTLVIDAGHGGHDPGAIGKQAKEKNINLATALAFGRLVETNCPDVKVVYTRKSDTFVTLHNRAEVANRNKADLFVSLHTNAVQRGHSIRGAETYTLGMARAEANLEVAKRENSVILVENDYQTRYQGFDPNKSESYIIFEMLQDHNMAKSVQFAQSIQSQLQSAGRQNRGVHQAGFLVLRETTMPSVLVELGYITNAEDEAFLASQAGPQKMGLAIYNAFLAFYKHHSGSTQPEIVEPIPDPDNGTPPGQTAETADLTNHEDCRQQTPAPQPTATGQETSQPQTPGNTESSDKIEFRVQFTTSGTKLPASKYTDLTDVRFYKENGILKYTAGNFTTFATAQKYRNQIAKKHKDAFVVAFRNGERIDLQEARRLTK